MPASDFDAALKERIIAFQKASGLAGDGIVGKKTWALLEKVSADTLGTTKNASGTSTDTTVKNTETSTNQNTEEITAKAPADMSLEEFMSSYPTLYRILDKLRDGTLKHVLKDEAGYDGDEALAQIEEALQSAKS